MRIIFEKPDGTIGILIPSPNWEGTMEELAEKDVPFDYPHIIVETDIIPADRMFRGAWRKGAAKVVVDLPAAKNIAHDIRRAKRDEEFAPHDDIISKNIPGSNLAAAEQSRQEIRGRYEGIQTNIDNAPDVTDLTDIVREIEALRAQIQ